MRKIEAMASGCCGAASGGVDRADGVRGCGQGCRRVGCIYDRLHLYVCCVSAQWFVGSSPFGYGPGQCRVFSGCCGGGYADQRFSYGYWVGAVIAGVFTGILCFALLQLCAALTRRQRNHLDNPKDEE